MDSGKMGLTESYNYFNTDLADPRTNNWWLMPSLVPLTLIQLVYLYLVLVYFPRYMQNREPYSLKGFITCYNVFQIITNTGLVYGVLTGGWTTGRVTVGCELVDYSMDPMSYKLAEMMWWTLILKLLDLVETVVFVLRKKDRQISFLHLYHHISTPTITWLVTKYYAGGMFTFHVIINASVHIIMYTYYLLASRGPQIRRLISPFKPYITTIQMVQFCIMLAHMCQQLLPSCRMPISMPLICIGDLLINFYFFHNFYQKNYMKNKKTS